MKISNKIIDDTVSEVAGEDVVELVHALKNKKNISEFKLADTIKKEVNMTRNMLYRLYDSNLVSFIRKKDKKKGWYIYYWTFNVKRITYLSEVLKKKKLEILNDRLKREQDGQFYVCDSRCIRLDFEQAMNFEFKCPECAELINLEDNSEKIINIEKEIKQLSIVKSSTKNKITKKVGKNKKKTTKKKK
jgi:transcription initiation factor TFIIE subunit alpha